MSIAVSIKEAADLTGLPAKTIRYYEDIGLVSPVRAANGYRVFHENDVHKLKFLAKGRSLGFTIEDCRTLLALYSNENRASADVKRIAKEHVSVIDTKITELQSMRETLAHLVATCAGDDRPNCPIINELSSIGEK